MRTRFFTLVILSSMCLLLPCRVVSATPILEIGDAGGLPGTAQVAFGTGSLTSISGTLIPATDTDMFLIYLPGGTTFSATTAGGASFDTELFLFNSSGFGVYANDDTSGFAASSTLPAGHALTPNVAGLYYLAITQCCVEPGNAAGGIFNASSNHNAVVGPVGPGGAGAITLYSGAPDQAPGGGAYTIFLTGAEFVPSPTAVPEPASLTLLGTALTALAVRRRRNRPREANQRGLNPGPSATVQFVLPAAADN
jgi:hypothetical protein